MKKFLESLTFKTQYQLVALARHNRKYISKMRFEAVMSLLTFANQMKIVSDFLPDGVSVFAKIEDAFMNVNSAYCEDDEVLLFSEGLVLEGWQMAALFNGGVIDGVFYSTPLGLEDTEGLSEFDVPIMEYSYSEMTGCFLSGSSLIFTPDFAGMLVSERLFDLIRRK